MLSERMFWRLPMRHGVQHNPPTHLLTQHQANPPVEVFAIGKHGALIGGHGGMKTSPCTKVTSLMVLFSFTSTTKVVLQQLLRNVYREMNWAILSLQERCELFGLMVEVKNPLKHFSMRVIKALCS
jgi:hypothetical protein